MKWTRRWKGGRVYVGRDGKDVYWLDRSHAGKRYGIALEGLTERQAEAELALFYRDPVSYRSPIEAEKERLRVEEKEEDARCLLTEEVVRRFEAWYLAKATRAKDAEMTASYVRWWMSRLGVDVDVAQVTLRDLRRCLSSAQTARRNRIMSWKAFCSWLREEEAVLARSDDASLDLHAPAARPEKSVRDKGYGVPFVERTYSAMSSWSSKRAGWSISAEQAQEARDVVLLKARTGMHQTEVERVARGEAKLRAVDDPVIRGTVTFIHKSGKKHTLSLDARGYAAALRLTNARDVDRLYARVRRVLERAAKNLGTPMLQLGELRHSFTTWARTTGEMYTPTGRGVPVEQVAAVLGHDNVRTTSFFYDGTQVPPIIRFPIDLVNPEDPVEAGALRLVASEGGAT